MRMSISDGLDARRKERGVLPEQDLPQLARRCYDLCDATLKRNAIERLGGIDGPLLQIGAVLLKDGPQSFDTGTVSLPL